MFVPHWKHTSPRPVTGIALRLLYPVRRFRITPDLAHTVGYAYPGLTPLVHTMSVSGDTVGRERQVTGYAFLAFDCLEMMTSLRLRFPREKGRTGSWSPTLIHSRITLQKKWKQKILHTLALFNNGAIQDPRLTAPQKQRRGHWDATTLQNTQLPLVHSDVARRMETRAAPSVLTN
jgi:hypothetical protein